MDEIPEARTLSEDAVAAMVAAVTPAREVVAARRNDRGFCTVYRVVVAGEGDRRTLYLKASPDGQRWGIPTEARLQAVLDATTSLPVPAVDGFGHVRHCGPELSGGEPSGDPATLTVGDPYDAWADALRSYAGSELDRHGDSRFSALTPEIESWVEDAIADLQGPFEPVLGRNDHGLHNLLVAPDGAVTAMLDWGYTLAVPAAFDVEFAVYLFGGAFLAGLPDVRDRRALVREALLSGYRSEAPARAGALATPEPLYEALAMVRVMNDFEHLTIPDGTEGGAMDRIEADARELLAEGSPRSGPGGHSPSQ